jgi:TonB-dependent starch-binding outer membrane protein SusC
MNFKKLVMPTLLGLFACLFVISAQAQNKTISGRVTDAKDGSPLFGVSVVVKGSKSGTQTAADGTFKISVPSSTTTLVISSVGFANQEVNVSSRSSVEVALAGSADQLNDVVVIGYGTARKKDLTGSVVSLQAKNFNQGMIVSPSQLLQNKVAGLEVTNTSGQPGAAPTIQIRGTTSIRSNNKPLFVVDGVPLDGGTARPNIGNSFGSTPGSDPLLFIDPNSIAQIDVLKDASSAAIYGSRGANGVIVITTKKATAGPLKLEFGTDFGTNIGYMKRFEVLDATQYRAALKKYNQPQSLDGGFDVDALKEITQNTLSQNYNLAVSGGNEVGRIRASFLASKNIGFLKKSALDKYLATIGGNYKFLDKKLTLDFSLIAGNYAEQLTSISNTAGSQGNIISSALSWNPTQQLGAPGNNYIFPSSGSGNPLAFNDAYSDKSNVFSILGNISAAYKITNKLEYKFLFGINQGVGQRLQNLEGWIVGITGVSGLGTAQIANAKLNSQTINHTLTYRTDVAKDLSLEALAGYEYFKTNFSGNGISAFGFNTNLNQTSRIPIPYTSMMANASTQNPFFSYTNPTAELQSYFARATLNYKDKYLFTGTFRADGSSKFGANNKYGYFPSAGFRWVASNEDFLKGSKSISNLSLRASWGITGNQEYPAGSSQEQFALNSFNNAPQVVNGNPNLKWEKSTTYNFGVDFSLLSGKLYGSVDYYNRSTTNILFQTNAIQPAPSSISFINLPDAKLNNSGVELALGATVMERSEFAWDVNFNIAYNKNIIKDFKDPNTGRDLLVNTGEISGQGVSGTLAQVMANNQPVNVFYLKAFKGFDAAGNQQIADNPTFSGDPNPSYLYGFGTTVRWKKFTFNMNAGGALGFLIYNNTATSVTNIAGIAQGRNIDLAAYNSNEGVASGVGASTRFLEKGDYFKLRNLTVRYSFGSAGKYIKNLNAFVSATNLLVLTKFTGFDPEVNIDKSANSYPSRSIEYVPYPTPRTISFGFNFNL